MFFIKDDNNEMKYRGTVFQVQKEEKYVDANLSTHEKIQENGTEGWRNSQWRTRFVGKAFDKAKELSDKDKIALTSFKIENVYVKEKNTSYLNVIVFDFVTPSELKAFDDARDAVKNTDPNA